MTEQPKNEKETWGKSWLNWMDNHKTATAFFAMTLFSVVITIFAFCRSNSIFKESQAKIVENQAAQIEGVKSALATIHNNANKAFVSNEDRIQKLISDSLFAKIPELNNTQQAVLKKYIKAVVAASSSEMAYKDWVKELNATLTQKQVSQIQQESKSFLELEFNRIQNEYEALALWAGILTVVFLIFSFYSLFKADDLVKQGKEGLKEIGEIKKESQATIQKTLEAHSSIQTKISQSEQAIKNIDQSRISIETEISQINTKLDSVKKIFDENEALQKLYNTLLIDMATVEEKIKLLSLDIDENGSRIDELNSKLPNASIISDEENEKNEMFDSEEDMDDEEDDSKEAESDIDDSIK